MNSEKEIEIARAIKWGSMVLVILGLFLLVQTLGAFKDLRGTNPNYNSISVTGEGEVFATADIATFSFSVSADAATVSAAQTSVTTKMDAVLASLEEIGVEDRDIRTSNYNVYPKYTYTSVPCTPTYCPPSRSIPDGYTVSHDVSVKVRKTDDAGRVLALVGERGATNVSSLSFTTDDPSALQDEARKMAIEDAKSKAEDLADSLGVKLGRVVTFYDNQGGYPMPMYDTKAEMSVRLQDGAGAPTLPMGENETRVNVTVVYEIR